MSYRPLPAITETADHLDHLLRSQRHPTRKQRLHLLWLVKTERVTSQVQAADHLALHRNTIGQWLTLYRNGGLEALLHLAKRGKKPGQRIVPQPVYNALEQKLNTQHGFAGYDAIQAWLKTEFDLEVPYKSVYTLVRYRMKAKLKTPRPHPI